MCTARETCQLVKIKYTHCMYVEVSAEELKPLESKPSRDDELQKNARIEGNEKRDPRPISRVSMYSYFLECASSGVTFYPSCVKDPLFDAARRNAMQRNATQRNELSVDTLRDNSITFHSYQLGRAGPSPRTTFTHVRTSVSHRDQRFARAVCKIQILHISTFH